MSRPVVEVTAASRLHFGMFSFGRSEVRQFGGMGAMIAGPGLRLRISPAKALAVTGPLADRALQVVRRVVESLAAEPSPCLLSRGEGGSKDLVCHIEILSAPREHVGLGVGTQLALSVAAGIRRFLRLPDLSPQELAAAAGRGERSAIGTHGFFCGGWLIEAGKEANESLSPLVERLEIPAAWRFALIVPRKVQGLHGLNERRAFADLPPVPADVTDRLRQTAMYEIAPALAAADFEATSDGLYRFNHEAGRCFAASQHGAYADEPTAALVARLRSWGIAGVGQSSWGPTVFALERDEASAADLVARLNQEKTVSEYEFVLTPPANHAAQIVVAGDPD